MKYHVPQAPVVSQKRVGAKIYVLTIACGEIAAEAQPGQFVHLRCTGGLDPLLRRPLSIFQADAQKGVISLCYQVVGKGTELLSTLKTGAVLDVLGPLGNGFDTEMNGKKAGLVGGGMGVAPLLFLGQVLAAQNRVQAFWGARSRDLLPPLVGVKVNEEEQANEESRLEKDGQAPKIKAPRKECPVFPYLLATEDGSGGRRGLVTSLLEEWLALETPDRLYACGPRPMLSAVAQLAEDKGIPLQVSLEAVMACGVGACLGCTCAKAVAPEAAKAADVTGQTQAVVKIDGAGGTAVLHDLDVEKRLKVCADGPVFWSWEVDWDENRHGK